MGLALAGCIGPRGGHYVGGDASALLFHSHSQAQTDEFCRVDMHAHIIYSASEPAALGLTPEEQLRRHYRICMANMGYPDADLEPAAPVAPAPN
jgi:hypothetical protein